MDKIRAAIVGYGNIGQFAVEAVQAAPDMELAGIVRRKGGGHIGNAPVVSHIDQLDCVDVAILCTPSRSVEENALRYLSMGFHTVDSFDIHSSIPHLRKTLSAAAKKAGRTAVVSAGWDPGSDSIVRALLEACAPKGVTYTNFGPGMSMGHSVAARAIDGVADALSVTIPLGTGIHRRMVYVQLEPGADFSEVSTSIKNDNYFSSDETHVIQVEDVEEYVDKGHGVYLTRKGVSGATHNQLFEFSMKVNNPALTSQIMVACARACTRQQPGAYTMIELPMVDLLPGSRDTWVKKLV